MCTTVNVYLSSSCHVKHKVASMQTGRALWDFCSSAHCCEHLQICVIRTLAFDENKAERAQRGLDLGALDAMSWPEYVWEYLYMHEDDLRSHRHDLSGLTTPLELCCLWASPPHAWTCAVRCSCLLLPHLPRLHLLVHLEVTGLGYNIAWLPSEPG